MLSVPDPSWKLCPDIVADETFEERYTDEEEEDFDDE